MAPARCGALNRGELRERGLPCFPFAPREAWEAFRAPPGGPCHTEGVNPRAISSLLIPHGFKKNSLSRVQMQP